jgi:hypothetical protein
MVKITVSYQIPGYKILELVVESEPISSSYHYDPCSTSISESSNLVLTGERTYFRAREQSSTRFSVQNVDENEEEEK